MGVQFHPESICSGHGDRLIANFLREGSVPARAARTTDAIAPRTVQTKPRRRVLTRLLPGFPDSERVFVGLFAEETTAFWLDSSRAEPGLARFSFMGVPRGVAPSLAYDVAEGTVHIRRGGQCQVRTATALDALQSLLDEIATQPTPELPFAGGFVGYFGYEMKGDLGSPNRHFSPIPNAQWMLAEHFLAFDHERRTLVAVGLVADGQQHAEWDRWVDGVEQALSTLPPLVPVTPSPPPGGDAAITARLDVGEDEYQTDVERCLEKLHAGESYELCLTTRATLPPLRTPLDYYRILRMLSPAPYAAYIRFGETTLLCSSPERFLAASADGRLSSKPIKGTAARSANPVVDAAAREQLRKSDKDRAENLMIVDLVRNDLGRVCEQGSVAVPRLMAIESYATVHHMVTTVEGQLLPQHTALDAVRASFPGGSMTGAPKLRSMDILESIERSARGVYSGSIGYLSADGAADLNIVIRTAVATPHETKLGVGGAIVALSDPADEYAEILLKAGALLKAYASRSAGTPSATLFPWQARRRRRRLRSNSPSLPRGRRDEDRLPGQ